VEIAASSAAPPPSSRITVEEAVENLEAVRLKRAAIFDDASDGKLIKTDKDVFWYREIRRGAWSAARAAIGFRSKEEDWNEEYDQAQLEKLRKAEEVLQSLLASCLETNGDGPAGQDFN
jgi:hypothetical protein